MNFIFEWNNTISGIEINNGNVLLSISHLSIEISSLVLVSENVLRSCTESFFNTSISRMRNKL